MFSAMLLAISIVALAQFALYYWRAVLTGVASQPISNRVLEAAKLEEPNLHGNDFEKLAELLKLTPELHGNGGHLGPVRVYYNMVGFFSSLSPAFSAWCEEERVLCARYAAVRVDRRLEANLAQAAALRSC
jgi:hypothetical protein